MSQLINAAKFGVLAAIAFFGPKIITESGNYLARVEHRDDPARSSFSLVRPSDRERNAPPSGDNLPERPPFDAGERGSYSVRYGSAPVRETKLEQRSSFTEITPVMTPLDLAVRFDRTPRWIVSTWPRVRTDDTDRTLRGYRVPLLTGTKPDDLSGALTYYFDSRAMRRISFVGRTGDFRKLLAYLEYRFGMTLDDDTPPSEYRYHSTLASDRGAAGEISRLTIRGAAVFDAAEPENRFNVTFDLFAP